MEAVIETNGLSKTYGSVTALDRLTLSIPKGGVYGVLGPNGAGKSTLFRILLGLIQPSQGTARVMGGAVGEVAHMRRTGSMIETPRFPPYLTAREVLRWLAQGHGQAGSANVDGWLQRVGLAEASGRKVRGFSVGMMQRLGVAAALMTRPELVILDEPTSGMDPPGIQEMRALIRSLPAEGVTVILASHQLLEVQRVCDRVAILNKGRLVREGLVSELTATGERLRLQVGQTEKALGLLGLKGTREGETVLADVSRADGPGVIRALVEGGVDIHEARWVGTDLEAVFFTETGSVRQPEADR